MRQTPQIAAGLIVSFQQIAVNDHAPAKACSQGNSQQIVITLGISGSFQPGINLRQCTGQCFPIRKQVSVVIDEYRYSETILQIRAKGYPVPECGEIRQVAYDSGFIVCRSWKGKADGFRTGRKKGLYGFKSFSDCM